MASPCIGFEIGLGHICWYFRAYICSKILKVLHPCIGFGIGLGHIWGHANAWIWYIHAYAWILYIHVLSHISHIPKAEIFGFMFQYLSSERMGLRFWANPIHNTWLDHGEISRTRCTPFCPVMALPIMTMWNKILKDLATLEILEQATLARAMEIAPTPFSVATNFARLQKSFATRLNVCTSKPYLVEF